MSNLSLFYALPSFDALYGGAFGELTGGWQEVEVPQAAVEPPGRFVHGGHLARRFACTRPEWCSQQEGGA